MICKLVAESVTINLLRFISSDHNELKRLTFFGLGYSAPKVIGLGFRVQGA